MKRRKVLQVSGSVLASAGAMTATSGFSRVESQRRAKIEVGDQPGEELYCEGRNEDFWEPGFSDGGAQDPTHVKEDDHLFLRAVRPGNFNLEETWVTIDTVTLTDWSQIEIDWENTGDNTNRNLSYLVVSDDQSGDHTVFDARLDKQGSFGRTTDLLDVSGLTGDYYVRIHARNTTPGNNPSIISTYCVTLLP